MIELQEGGFGWDFVLRNLRTGKSIIVLSDWEYPATASIFGWQPCHNSTDGTVRCPECGQTASDLIQSAFDYLAMNIGVCVEDDGYFDEEEWED